MTQQIESLPQERLTIIIDIAGRAATGKTQLAACVVDWLQACLQEENVRINGAELMRWIKDDRRPSNRPDMSGLFVRADVVHTDGSHLVMHDLDGVFVVQAAYARDDTFEIFLPKSGGVSAKVYLQSDQEMPPVGKEILLVADRDGDSDLVCHEWSLTSDAT